MYRQNFNSIIVRLKVTGPIGIAVAAIAFQFNYCTIKSHVRDKHPCSKQHFNSIIVRLKADGAYPGLVSLNEFQFNYCTIKRLL